MTKIIPYGKQEITEADLDAVIAVLKGDFLTQGPAITAFEKAFSDYIGCKYSVAVANGTAALHLCAMALNVKPGDKVIVPPISFVASANCVKYCGGNVVFSDIDAATLTLDFNKVKKLLKSSSPGTYQGMILVDFGGHPVQMDAFKALANEHGMWIIEDACHAPGGFFTDANGDKQMAGNGRYADLAIFSFHPVKHIAAGEGGMITTNDKALYERLLTLRTHGITRDPSKYNNSIVEVGGDPATGHYPGWYMEMQELGYNYRLTDFQAALGQSQLERADTGLERRLAIAAKYEDAFSGINPIQTRYANYPSGEHFRNSYHLYIIQVEDRLGLYNYLRSKNIFVQIHYYPIHLMPYYRAFGSKPGDMPVAEAYYAHCISLPMYPTLTDEEQQYVIDSIISFINE
jgi:UDP-4-amino-4,6-dideoxy-N-acetyl-beta-L-altrosamine transaminase